MIDGKRRGARCSQPPPSALLAQALCEGKWGEIPPRAALGPFTLGRQVAGGCVTQEALECVLLPPPPPGASVPPPSPACVPVGVCFLRSGALAS